jgi:hypothetical protein
MASIQGECLAGVKAVSGGIHCISEVPYDVQVLAAFSMLLARRALDRGRQPSRGQNGVRCGP